MGTRSSSRAAVALAALVLLASVDVAPTAAQTEGVVWGGEVHAERDSLERWLGARGATYETWAERHPAAAARLEGRQEARTTTDESEPEEEPEEEALLPLVVPGAPDSGGLTPVEAALLAGLAFSVALLAAGGLLMTPRAWSMLPPTLAISAGRNGVRVAAAGLGLLCAVLASSLVLA